jgi:hypothetical protein
MKAKILIAINVDPEEYPMPVDDRIEDELEKALEEFFYDIDGINVKSIRVITE